MNLTKSILKAILGFISIIFLIWGIFWSYLLFFGSRQLGGILIFIEEFVAQSSVLMVALCFSATIILLKIFANKKRTNPKQYYTIFSIGILITGLNSVSLLATPFTIMKGDAEFNTAFGLNWRNEIPNHVKDKFLPLPYNLPSHFLTIPRDSVNVQKDILYYEGENITLYFDVYTPNGDPSELPGNGSVIINLHPGAWSSGGKGTWNMISTSKYLAAQGYVVFDIQYGLIEWFQYAAPAPETPENVLGNFTIEDQVRHIGIFTKRLANDFYMDYGANLDSVYFMGRSAGAHLSGVSGLGFNEDYHNDTFSDKIKVKGAIPLYPPSAAPEFLLKETKAENPENYNAYNLSALSDDEDPPVLIFQGWSDGQVEIEGILKLEKQMEFSGVTTCLLEFPFAGHASDFVLSTNIGQVWIYYLERFLYITQ
ncbi:MAG: membrane protein of unknown function [Promethearchaeota archaeon]|nr:MAG: membrane protein of unknown function [Candidatus Lokiarchaeota archaeon]